MTVLLGPQVEHITDNASNSSGRATIGLKRKRSKSRVRWWPNAGFIPGSTDVFCEPVLLAGVSIVSGSTGH